MTALRLAFVLLLFLSACGQDRPSVNFDPRKGDLASTWTQAWISTPWEPDIRRMDSAERERPAGRGSVPAIIYLHGCTGFGGPAEESLVREMANAGFAVFIPDSMARSFRPLQCNPDDQTGGYNRFVYYLRLAEVSYAVQMLQGVDWVDLQRLYLVGGSEGGVAAALYRGDEFRARVVFQWTCHGAALVHGISDTAEPMLSIVNAGDPWYSEARTRNQRGSCAEFYTHPASDEILLQEEGVHSIITRPEMRTAIVSYLSAINK